MADSEDVDPDPVPRPEELESFFHLVDVRRDGETLQYVGESLVPERALLDRVAPAFYEAGYEVDLRQVEGGHVLLARPIGTRPDGIPWANLGLLIATVLTTLFVGAYGWYYVPLSTIRSNPLTMLQAWPFTAAVLGVLLTHELGHYVAGRYYGVNVSLPYVIPFVFPFGTLGAIIRMKGRIPSRRVLFDIGAAGPIAGLLATVVVTAIGLSLDPIAVPERVLQRSGEVIVFNDPPLLAWIADALGRPTGYEDPTKAVHPVVIGGWVGMFFTLLNLLPVGQLDGGHMTRAMLGERQETLAALVPGALFSIAAYLHLVLDYGINESVGLWAFWGLFATVIAVSGSATPLDESELGWPRLIVGIATFLVGATCFMLVPVQVVAA
ncbi:site-2 protease family protein [Halopenitus persicus]|uniref:site-2 protease family protein n=1 Tax=Halopenitus persicus TaxID=1048396 RepID=UPI000BBA4D6A|nr:site-2 protease family protein [Halopenitus persicus]